MYSYAKFVIKCKAIIGPSARSNSNSSEAGGRKTARKFSHWGWMVIYNNLKKKSFILECREGKYS